MRRIIAIPHTPTAPDTPHPHPAAPLELKQRFSEFLAKMNSSASTQSASSKSVGVYNEFWEAPSRFWKPRIRHLEEAEMNAIMVRVNNGILLCDH